MIERNVIYISVLRKLIKLLINHRCRGVKVGGSQPPPEFCRGGGLNPPDFERIYKKIDHMCYYVHVISIGGGGGLGSL